MNASGSKYRTWRSTKPRPKSGWRWCATLLLLLVLPTISRAQAPIPSADAHPDATAGATNVVFGDSGLRVSGANYVLTVGGYVQGQGRLFWSDRTGQATDKVLFRRIRPDTEFDVGEWLSFRFMPDFAGNTVVVQDVYLDLKKSAALGVRIGKFKAPLGLEALRSDRDASFVERSLTSNLFPCRDLGAQMQGSLAAKSINYAVGFFSGAADAGNANFAWRSGYVVAARVFIQPFLSHRGSSLRKLGLGIAGSSGQDHGALPSLKTEGQNTFFRYSSTAAAYGLHSRILPQAYYYGGPVGIIAEYAISSQEVHRGKQTRTLTNRGWQIAGSVLLTGETNSYSGVKPAHAFEPTRNLSHLGGWELKLRYSRLDVDPAAFPFFANPNTSAAGGREWVTGVNWHLHRHAKLMIDYEHTTFRRASASVRQSPAESALLSTLQLAF